MPRPPRPVPPPAQRRLQPTPRPPEDQFTESGRMRCGFLTPRSIYRRHILRLLLAAPNQAVKAREVRQTIERRMVGRFTDADLSLLRRGQPRWVNAMQWERKKMVMEGLLETTGSAGHGTWRLTREGVRAARAEVG